MMNPLMQFFMKGLVFTLLCVVGIISLSTVGQACEKSTSPASGTLDKVTGCMANQKGALLQGASVQEVSITNSTSTDERGVYEITASNEKAG